MKRVVASCFILMIATSSLPAQEWATDWISRVFPQGNMQPDSLVALLRLEFQKAVGTKAPEFSFQQLDKDKLQTPSDYCGSVLLVNFWATNCSGCRYEMPDLSRLQESYRDKGLRVVFLSSEPKEKLINYFAVHKTTGTKGTMNRNQLKRPYQC